MLKLSSVSAMLFLCSHAYAADYANFPFSENSIWKTPIGVGAIYDDSSSVVTTIRDKNKNYPWFSFINGNVSVYKAAYANPAVTWGYKSKPGAALPYAVTSGVKLCYSTSTNCSTFNTFKYRTPTSIDFSDLKDRVAVIISFDGKSAIEVYHAYPIIDNSGYVSGTLSYTDLTGSGISSVDGQSVGIRAAGVSLFGGLIRKAEMQQKLINHAIVIGVSRNLLKAGSTSKSQRVWPASNTDGNSYGDAATCISNTVSTLRAKTPTLSLASATRTAIDGCPYSGVIPMGTMYALPKDIDIDDIGLKTEEGKAIARALKYYGGYVLDATGVSTGLISGTTNNYQSTTTLGMSETGIPAASSGFFADKYIILSKLVRITNSTADAIGGPGDRLIDDEKALGLYK